MRSKISPWESSFDISLCFLPPSWRWGAESLSTCVAASDFRLTLPPLLAISFNRIVGFAFGPPFAFPRMVVFLAVGFDSAETFRFYLAVFSADYFGPMLQNSRDTDYRRNFYLRIPRNAGYSADRNKHNSSLLDSGPANYLLSVDRPEISQNSMAPFLPILNFLHLLLFPLLTHRLHRLSFLWFDFSLPPFVTLLSCSNWSAKFCLSESTSLCCSVIFPTSPNIVINIFSIFLYHVHFPPEQN